MQKQKNLTNLVVVEGFLATPVNLVFEGEKNTHKATFRLNNPCQIGRNKYSNDFHVVVYGRKAKECSEDLAQGDKCAVTGKLIKWFKGGKNGVSQTGVTIIASEISY